ncbi:MAG: hypothetical protein HY000_06445 [Planctomycetes bacterium]|nr:hypothetical protein [Planctomycetota bacterium]
MKDVREIVDGDSLPIGTKTIQDLLNLGTVELYLEVVMRHDRRGTGSG